MNAQMKIGLAVALGLLVLVDQAFAGILPPPPLPPPSTPEAVPEIAVSSGLAVMALLITICAMFYSRRKQS
jgi:hypothetical protein